MKRFVKVLLGVLLVGLVLQLPIFQPAKNYSATAPLDDIYKVHEIPMDIQMDFNNACYDCHSNYTEHYPWYYHIQPVSWWMDRHIRMAKEALNFSEFAAYSKAEQAARFRKIQEVMEEKTMPLPTYLSMHHKAQLSDKEYQKVAAWAKKMADTLQ